MLSHADLCVLALTYELDEKEKEVARTPEAETTAREDTEVQSAASEEVAPPRSEDSQAVADGANVENDLVENITSDDEGPPLSASEDEE